MNEGRWPAGIGYRTRLGWQKNQGESAPPDWLTINSRSLSGLGIAVQLARGCRTRCEEEYPLREHLFPNDVRNAEEAEKS